MAPEQARRKVVNESSDVYNFGATMYRLLTGQLPVDPKLAQTLELEGTDWDKAIRPVKEYASQTPTELATLVQRCLTFHPHVRPKLSDEVKPALEELVRNLVRSPKDRLEAIKW
jgi:serine/threonine-protein kinase